MALDHAYLDGRRGLNPADFITPEDPAVQAVAASIVEKLGEEDSSASRLREAYNYVALNIRYVTDKKHWGYLEVWAMPDETLKRGLGDCEDTSFLLCSLLLALGVKARVVFGEWKGEGHAWVEAATDGASGILETTSNQPFSGFADPAAYYAESGFGVDFQDPFMAFLAYVAPGFVLFGIGAFLMIDDCQDAFKMELSTYGEKPGKHGILKGVAIPGLPPHIHHWWIGLLLVILSIILLALGVVLWMLKYL